MHFNIAKSFGFFSDWLVMAFYDKLKVSSISQFNLISLTLVLQLCLICQLIDYFSYFFTAN